MFVTPSQLNGIAPTVIEHLVNRISYCSCNSCLENSNIVFFFFFQNKPVSLQSQTTHTNPCLGRYFILQNLSDMADLPGMDEDLTFSKEIAAKMLQYKALRYSNTSRLQFRLNLLINSACKIYQIFTLCLFVSFVFIRTQKCNFVCFYSFFRCLFVAHSFLLAKKWCEAASLYNRVLSHATSAVTHFQEIDSPQTQV